MRLLALDPGTGQTRVLLEDTDPHWLEIVPGVPARPRRADRVGPGRRRTPAAWWCWPRARSRPPVTPPGLQVRGVLDVDGEVVLFAASAEPTEVELWTYGPAGLQPGRQQGGRTGRHSRGRHSTGRQPGPGRTRSARAAASKAAPAGGTTVTGAATWRPTA